jgi:hypothetical protein
VGDDACTVCGGPIEAVVMSGFGVDGEPWAWSEDARCGNCGHHFSRPIDPPELHGGRSVPLAPWKPYVPDPD